MRVHVCGSRGSTPVAGSNFLRYGGNTSCVAVAHRDDDLPSLILDAGTGIRALDEIFGSTPFRGTIALGHLHWDHTQGLPFFHAADNERAEVQVVMPGPGNGADILRPLMSPPFFPIHPEELRGQWSFDAIEPGTYHWAGFTATALEIPHKGGRAFGYRVQDGSASLAYLSDHNPTSFGAGPGGMGEVHDSAVELATDVDLLIHDAQHLASELDEKAFLGHSSPEYAVQLAEEAGARNVLLFHHDPSRTDDQIDALLAGLVSRVPVTAARDGMTIELPIRAL